MHASCAERHQAFYAIYLATDRYVLRKPSAQNACHAPANTEQRVKADHQMACQVWGNPISKKQPYYIYMRIARAKNGMCELHWTIEFQFTTARYLEDL